jgi:hypothetical protein
MDKDGRRLAYEVIWTCSHTGSIKEQHYPETSVHLRGMPRQKLILAGALSCHGNCIRCGLACVASRGHSLETSGRAPLLSASHLLSSSWCTCPHRAVCVRSHLRWVALPNPYLYACYPESGSSLWPHRHARLLEAVVCAAMRVCRGTTGVEWPCGDRGGKQCVDRQRLSTQLPDSHTSASAVTQVPCRDCHRGRGSKWQGDGRGDGCHEASTWQHPGPGGNADKSVVGRVPPDKVA